MKKVLFLVVLLTLATLFLQNCDTTEPNNKAKITLTALDASCTEVWLKLNTESINLPTEVAITESDTLINNYTITKNDTTLFVENLLPNKNYRFRALSKKANKKSQSVSVTTLDTTNHNFTWQTFTFGEHSGSSLYDVAIIDENNIWAVGQIFLNDSLGQPDLNLYNVVHWDGTQWKVKRIYVDYKGKPNLASLTGTFSLPSNDLIFTSGLPYLPTQNGWNLYHLWDLGVLNDDDGGVIKVWGSSVQNLYFVGREGTIVHYNGSAWRKIESGTKTIISDVWGITDPITFENEVYCAVSSFFLEPGKNDKKILKITSTNVIEEIIWDTNRNVETVWTNNRLVMYAGGDGLFVNKTGKWNEINLGVNYYSNHVRGLSLNNIFVVGGFGLVAHFNGIDWKVYNELLISNGNYVSLCLSENNVVIVGSEGNKAKIIIGTQN